MPPLPSRLTDSDYERLARWRYALRRFLRHAEVADRRAGISPAQYQLLVTVRGFPDGRPRIADLAEWLQITHQSAVGLVDRCVRGGLVRRADDRRDRRRVRVLLASRGRRVLRALALEHLAEIDRLGEAFPLPLSRARRRRK
ncbi:MAG TPA: MarR family transcriptional regulator [Thermoanaerobaculia bacterium]|nr:MarR family transcriptional regulator [Thermoanaerobaculia bacterium]